MVRVRLFHLSALGRRAAMMILAWAFVLGLATGGLLSTGCRALLETSRDALAQGAGVSEFVPTLLPIFFSGFAVYIKQPLLLVPIAFWKAFLFSCVGTGIALAWGTAGWLVGTLALFGSLCAMPVLWWYWLRHIGGQPFTCRTFLPALGTTALIGWVDSFLISPFLTSILIS